MTQNATETPGTYVTPLTLPANGDAVDGPGFLAFANQVAKRFTYLKGSHRIESIQVLSGSSEGTQNQTIAAPNFTALTGYTAVTAAALTGDTLLAIGHVSLSDNAGLGNISQAHFRLLLDGTALEGAAAGVGAVRGTAGVEGESLTVVGGHTFTAGSATPTVTGQVKCVDGAAAGMDWTGIYVLIALLLRPTT